MLSWYNYLNKLKNLTRLIHNEVLTTDELAIWELLLITIMNICMSGLGGMAYTPTKIIN